MSVNNILDLIAQEAQRQQDELCLIASENYVSPQVRQTLGSHLINKYAEGYPGARYYAGNKIIDQIESGAIGLAKQIFGSEHANVQPLSGAPANLAVYGALLSPGDTVLGMDLSHGGHLTHGHPVTLPAKIYNFIGYKTTSSGEIDYAQLEILAKKHLPKLILVGYSSYSREIDYQRIQKIAQEAGALTMADISHIAGLIAGDVMENPVPYFDVVTTTTHKTLRGPRGGMILCKEKFAKQIDKSVFPGLQGGPHQNQIAALAIALEEARQDDFKIYAQKVKENAQFLAHLLKKADFDLCFSSTQNHLMLLDLRRKNISGKIAQDALEKAGIITNMNAIPDDQAPPTNPSGLRLGTPAITTRGMGKGEVELIADFIIETLKDPQDLENLAKIRENVRSLTKQFPIP